MNKRSIKITGPAGSTSVGKSSSRKEVKARELLKQFRVLFSSIKAHYKEIEKQCGASGSQLWALAEIAKAPGLRMSDLASAMLIHPSTASNLVERLEVLELVKKERTQGDQRVVQLRITPQGRALIKRAPGPSVGLLLDALEKLPSDRVTMLSECMDALISHLPMRDDLAETKPLADL